MYKALNLMLGSLFNLIWICLVEFLSSVKSESLKLFIQEFVDHSLVENKIIFGTFERKVLNINKEKDEVKMGTY